MNGLMLMLYCSVGLDGPVVKTLHLHCTGYEFDPCLGTEIPYATWHSQNIFKKMKNSILFERPNLQG